MVRCRADDDVCEVLNPVPVNSVDYPCRTGPIMTMFSFSFEGESGLGKSTLINSLFLTDLYPERIIPGAAGTEAPTLL